MNYVDMLDSMEAAKYRVQRRMWPEDGDELLIDDILYVNIGNPTWDADKCNIPPARVSKWSTANRSGECVLVDIFELDMTAYDRRHDHAAYTKNNSMRMAHRLQMEARQ